MNNGKAFKIQANDTLGTAENGFIALKIYPNPSSGEIFIEGLKDKDATIEIISTEGRKIWESNQIVKG